MFGAGDVFWGICGGYQMLGRRLHDPEGIEGPAGSVDGLGLLNFETTMVGDKITTECQGHSPLLDAQFKGYEIHLGRTAGPDCDTPVFAIDGASMDGAVSPSGLVAGGYVHGLFDQDDFRRSFLTWAGGRSPTALNFHTQVDETLDALGAHFEEHLNLDQLLALATSARY